MTSAFNLFEIILIFTGMFMLNTSWMFWSLLVLYMLVQSAYKNKFYKEEEEE